MKKQLKDLSVKGKKVLVRCDYNIPLNEDNTIADDIRIQNTLPTLNYILDNGGSAILMSHLGRPKGKPDPKFSMKPVAEKLAEILQKEIIFADYDDVVNEEVKKIAEKMIPGEIMLLQNTRYREEEKENDMQFARQLAELADIYVDDAFGTAHRAHASTVGVAGYIPSALGFLMAKEIQVIGDALLNPKRPFTAILGGAKVSDKIGVITNLINIADNIIIGGGMAFTFVKALGFDVGKSLLEEDKIHLAAEILKDADSKNKRIILPVDFRLSKEFKDNCDCKECCWKEIPVDYMGLDIGKQSVEKFSEVIKKSATVIWNGPMGVFEFENFQYGTKAIAEQLAGQNIISIIGGGDSAAAVKKFGLEDKMTHISTGGGASLEFMEGKKLPAIEAIEDI